MLLSFRSSPRLRPFSLLERLGRVASLLLLLWRSGVRGDGSGRIGGGSGGSVEDDRVGKV